MMGAFDKGSEGGTNDSLDLLRAVEFYSTEKTLTHELKILKSNQNAGESRMK